MNQDESAAHNTLDDHFSRFGRRLRGILGEGRIPRAEKEAKAREAIRVVDDLIAGIEKDIWGDQQSYPPK